MDFGLILVDKWPMVTVDLQRVPTNDEEIDRFQAKFCAMLSLAVNGSERIQPCRIYLLFILDGIVGASLHQQMRAANFIGVVRDLAKQAVEATAVVTSNETARMLLEFIVQIQPLQSYHEIFDNREQGALWLQKLRDNKKNV